LLTYIHKYNQDFARFYKVV